MDENKKCIIQIYDILGGVVTYKGCTILISDDGLFAFSSGDTKHVYIQKNLIRVSVTEDAE